MKLIQGALSVLLACHGTVLARSCSLDQKYCAQSLMAIGNYQWQLDQAVFDYTGLYTNYEQSLSSGKRYLFECKGGRNGIIDLIQQCQGNCVNGTHGANDYCPGSSMVDGVEVEVEESVPENFQVQLNIERDGL